MSAVATKERPTNAAAEEPLRLMVERADLLRALTHAAPIVERRNTIPVLSNVLLEATTGGLRLTTTDLSLQVALTVPAEVSGCGAITVAADLLHSIVRELPSGSRIELKMSDERLSVVAGRSRYKVAALPSDQFPILQMEAPSADLLLPAGTLLATLSRVLFAQSSETISRWYLCGVNIDILDGKVTLAATDGDTLAWSTLTAPEKAELPNGAILPTKFCAALSKLLADKDGDVRLTFDGRKVVADIGDAKLTGKLVDGDYPNWRRICSLTATKRLIVDAGSFTAAVRRVALIAAERSRIIKLELSRDKLTASCASFESGTAIEEIPCVWDDSDMAIGFHGTRLLNVLNAAGSGEIHVDIVDPATPALFNNPSDESSKWMVTAARV